MNAHLPRQTARQVWPELSPPAFALLCFPLSLCTPPKKASLEEGRASLSLLIVKVPFPDRVEEEKRGTGGVVMASQKRRLWALRRPTFDGVVSFSLPRWSGVTRLIPTTRVIPSGMLMNVQERGQRALHTVYGEKQLRDWTDECWNSFSVCELLLAPALLRTKHPLLLSSRSLRFGEANVNKLAVLTTQELYGGLMPFARKQIAVHHSGCSAADGHWGNTYNQPRRVLWNPWSICHKTEGPVTRPAARAVCAGSGRGVKQTHLLQRNKVTHQQVRTGRCAVKRSLFSSTAGRGGD